jgi:hypothetical protein
MTSATKHRKARRTVPLSKAMVYWRSAPKPYVAVVEHPATAAVDRLFSCSGYRPDCCVFMP